jgi:hypothetical protein
MTRRIHSASDAQMNGIAEHESPFVGSGQNFAMTFNVRDVVDVNIFELNIPDAVKTQNGKRSHNAQVHFILSNLAFTKMLLARVCWLVPLPPRLYL